MLTHASCVVDTAVFGEIDEIWFPTGAHGGRKSHLPLVGGIALTTLIHDVEIKSKMIGTNVLHRFVLIEAVHKLLLGAGIKNDGGCPLLSEIILGFTVLVLGYFDEYRAPNDVSSQLIGLNVLV